MSTPEVVRVGTRRSALAKVQSQWVASRLEALGLTCRLVEIASEGDADRRTPLYEMEPESPGLFTKQLEVALLAGEIDLAVHSLKDLPTVQPPELILAAVPPRVDAEDALLVNLEKHAPHEPLGLASGAVVGTSSLRREAQVKALRPDLGVTPLRGNVPTRVRAVQEGKLDAILVARAGLLRLGLDPVGTVQAALPPDTFVPAPGQGALGLETRRDGPRALGVALRQLHDIQAERETRVERRCLQGLHGGCTLPLGARCSLQRDGRTLALTAFLGYFREGRVREWVGFERLHLIETDEERLVAKAVAHFRGWLATMKGVR